MTNSVLFIIGTSRESGNTRKVIDCLNDGREAPVVNLSDYKIGNYDYDHRNADDDFLSIVKQMLQYRTIVFATPIYWYAMSAQLKTFFDRFSDLVRVEKSSGRALAGRNTFLVASGTDKELPPGFEEPFRLSSKYMNMNYMGAFYSCVCTDLLLDAQVKERAQTFALKIFETS